MLEGKRILVTGGSLGLGKEVARCCLGSGADVMIAARSAESLRLAESELRVDARGEQSLATRKADVARRTDVEAMVAAAEARLGGLDGVVHCAGIQGPIGRSDEVAWDEWVAAVEINLIGTMLVCRAALPALIKADGGKIVTLSGGGATSPRPRFSAYAASKAAVVRLTEILAIEFADEGIEVNAVAPGALNSRMLDEVVQAGEELAGEEFEGAVRQASEGGASIAHAAELCAFLLSSRSDGISGRLISAPWDPWEQLPAHVEALSASDVYTLRRIVPEDRPNAGL